MNSSGEVRMPLSTACDQNWRETWNFSFTPTALEMSIFPLTSGV